ncbi:MAG: FAD-dependent oxidoreductase [Rhizobiaceae bacterium]
MGECEAIVVGAGVAGIMTALALQERGASVTMIDRWEPGHPRSASADYNRILRCIHGKDELYTNWVRQARLGWMELQREIGAELFVECGALIMAGEGHTAWEDATLPTFERLGIPHFRFDTDELRIRFPQFDFQKVAYGIWEPEAGMVMAHAAVVGGTGLFVRRGGTVQRGRVTCDSAERLHLDGRALEADVIIVATGAWLGEMYRRTIAPISNIVRQNIIYTSTPEGDQSYDAANMPCWVDHGMGAYGLPSINGHGVKAAIAWTHSIIDLDQDDRVVDDATFTKTRAYIRKRFPGLADQKAVDQKACQIAMTPDTHFIIDCHPEHENVLLLGGDSGHLFKHGPVVGDFAAGVALREYGTSDRFKINSRTSLSTGDSPSGR